jgi:hypothetical protein
MNARRMFRNHLSVAVLMTAFLITDSLMGGYLIPAGSIVSSAEARVGRPLTPGSVAGVARRTTRRVVRRSTIYVAALPPPALEPASTALRFGSAAGHTTSPMAAVTSSFMWTDPRRRRSVREGSWLSQTFSQRTAAMGSNPGILPSLRTFWRT